MQLMHCVLCLFVSSPHRLETSQPITAFSFLWPRPWRAEETGRRGHKSVGWREGWVLRMVGVVGFILSSSVYRSVSPSFVSHRVGCQSGELSVSVFLLPFCRLCVWALGGTLGMAGVLVFDPSSFCAWDVKASITTCDSQPIDHPVSQSVCLSVLASPRPPHPHIAKSSD